MTHDSGPFWRDRAAIVAAALGLACATAACSGGPSSPAPAASASASAAASATATAAATAAGDATPRALALAKPGGKSLVDRDIEQIQRSIEKNPTKADFFIMLGRKWIFKARESADPGFYLNANACADVVIDLDPRNREGLALRGLVLLNSHKFLEAKDIAMQVLARDPQNLLSLSILSDTELEVGNYDAATDAAQKMNDIKPNLPAYVRAAHLRWLRADVAGAKDLVKHAYDAKDLREPEPGAWVLVQGAIMFLEEGDYDGADKGFDLALHDVSDYPPALVGKARVALAKGQAASAVELLEKAYKASPLVDTAWLLGDAKEMAGDHAGAEAAYAEVLKRGRQSDGRTLAQFLATKGRDTEEATKLALAEKKIRDDIYTEDAIAWSHYRAGKLAEAREASDKARKLGTKDARILYHAGAIRVAAGDKAGGEKLVKEALALNPKFDVTGAAEAAKLVGSE